MRLYTEKGEFSLPEDFALELQSNNPIFSDEGSASVSFTVPATRENLEAAGRPDRFSRETAFSKSVECIFQTGTFQLQGSLIITDCNAKEIGCCLSFNEGNMYASEKDVKLKSILDGKKFFETDWPIDTMAVTTQTRMKDRSASVLKSFVVEVELMDGYHIKLNELEDTSDEGGISFGNIIYKARSYSYNGTTINVPEGYGLTAFPMVYHIVDVILTMLGYGVVRNDFCKESYKDLALLHPVADLMCKGNIYYKDFVPDITLSEFLQFLQKKFGAYVFLQGNKASVVILEELLSEAPAIDISKYTDDDYAISLPDEEHLSINLDTSMAEPPADDVAAFIKKYGNYTGVVDIPKVEGVYLHTPTGQFIRVKLDAGNYVQEKLGYNNFPAIKSASNNSSEISVDTEDKALPCRYLYGYYPSRLLLSLGAACHYNTAIAGEEESREHPLMIARAYFDGNFWRASVTGVEHNGTRLFTALNPEGLYQQFWQKFGTLKANLAPDLTVSIHLPERLLRDIDLSKPVLYQHSRALIKNINYTVSEDDMITGTVTLWILPDITYPNTI